MQFLSGTVGCFIDRILGAVLESKKYLTNEHVNLIATVCGAFVGIILSRVIIVKGIILIIDGMAGRPLAELGYKTTLEAAETPNMDKMAEIGICGIMDPIKPGIRAGSDTSHISILGYDPYQVYLVEAHSKQQVLV